MSGGHRYHTLHPEYIHTRIEEVKKARCRLCVLLVLIDDVDDVTQLMDITHIATFHHLTLLCAWSPKVPVKGCEDFGRSRGAVQECARCLETLKAFEHKPPDMLKGIVETDDRSRALDILTSIKGRR